MSGTIRRLRRAAIVAIFTFGFTALAAVLNPPDALNLVPVIAVFGWFILTPFVAIFDVPFLDDESEAERRRRERSEQESGPLQTLQERYAAGKISEEEFDRKVERILETSSDAPDGMGVDRATSGTSLGSLGDLDVSDPGSDATADAGPTTDPGSTDADPVDPESVTPDSAVPDSLDADPGDGEPIADDGGSVADERGSARDDADATGAEGERESGSGRDRELESEEN